jgi:hypothetical protein
MKKLIIILIIFASCSETMEKSAECLCTKKTYFITSQQVGNTVVYENVKNYTIFESIPCQAEVTRSFISDNLYFDIVCN